MRELRHPEVTPLAAGCTVRKWYSQHWHLHGLAAGPHSEIYPKILLINQSLPFWLKLLPVRFLYCANPGVLGGRGREHRQDTGYAERKEAGLGWAWAGPRAAQRPSTGHLTFLSLFPPGKRAGQSCLPQRLCQEEGADLREQQAWVCL